MTARRPRGVTVEDVARAAGVSRQTVSNALNAPHRLRPDTLTRVTVAIEELGYRPDQSARSLRTGSRRIIGYLTPPDDPFNPNPLMGGFLEALVEAAAAVGHRVLLFRPPQGDPRPVFDELIAAGQVDGFVLSDILRDDVRVGHLLERGQPFVTFGQTGRPSSWVDIDNNTAMIKVAELLARQGHRRVGYLGAAGDLPWIAERREGFRQGARRHGLEASAILEPASPADDPAELTAAVRDLLAVRDRPTALAAATDLTALAAYEAIRAEGLTVGRDVAVVGFNDLPLCGLLYPRLTSVRLPLPAIARALMDRLLAAIAGEAPDPVLLGAELVIRESTPDR